jgi:hypothetical protein
MNKFLVLIALVFSFNLMAQDSSLTIVAVGEAGVEKDKMIIQDVYAGSSLTQAQKNAAQELVTLMRNDFSFYQKKFFLITAGANNTATRPSTNYEYWGSKGVKYLGTVSVDKAGDSMSVTVVFEDIMSKKQIYSRTMQTDIANVRATGHRMANEIATLEEIKQLKKST